MWSILAIKRTKKVWGEGIGRGDGRGGEGGVGGEGREFKVSKWGPAGIFGLGDITA